ncbi:MAG: acyl--CoA ligase [Novosphingobium sp.]|nr:acyl--CoA ligase [Novosphingobium sp.]
MGDRPLSIIHGPPLDEEAGVGALTLNGWLEQVCAAGGEREALVFYENGERISWSYADLMAEARRVASALLACGTGKGTRVGVLMTNRPEFLSAVWGVALAGGVATALNTFSTATEFEHLLEASGISVLLMERRVLKKDFAAMLAEIEPQVRTVMPGAIASTRLPFLRHVAAIGGGEGAIEDWGAFLSRGDGLSPALVDVVSATVTPADPAVLFFSSGSTAKPKGILSAHRAVALQLWRWRRFYQTGPDARAWSANGFFFSGNFGMAIGGALTAGGSLVLQSTFQPEEALDLMACEKATMAIAWPHQWAQLAAAPNWLEVDLSAMKYVDPSHAFGRHPTISTDWDEPMSAYGNTETFTISSIYESGTSMEERAGSAGKPQPGLTFKIVDPLTGEIVPVGEPGEIAVKGVTLMMGYIGEPLDETLDEQGFFATGDAGHVDAEGRLYWSGRLNDIIKTGGANVSPLEVDAAIRKCPGVKVNQTVGVPHDTLGELVVTAVVPHEGAVLEEGAIRQFARETLASYKVPRRVLFFAENELETTGSAKIKTADLRELVAARIAAEG